MPKGEARTITVADVMTNALVTVEPAASVMDAASLMFSHQVGSVLVMEGSELVGIFTERDVLRVLAEGDNGRGAETGIAEWVTLMPEVIGPDATLGEALDKMIAARFRHLPVVQNDAVVGIVSIRDLSRGILA